MDGVEEFSTSKKETRVELLNFERTTEKESEDAIVLHCEHSMKK